MSYLFRVQPRPAQLKALKRIYKQKRLGLFGDPGTGKTKVALDFMGAMFGSGKAARALVIAPARTLGTWEEQIEIHTPDLPYKIIDELSSLEAVVKCKAEGTIIISYDFAWRHKKLLIKWKPQIIFIDEGHKIKNPYSKRARAIHRIGREAEYAVDMTGTPKGNKKILDLWSHMRFIKEDVLDSRFRDFKKTYGVWGGFGGFKLLKFKRVDELAKKVEPWVMYIRKTGLPPQQFIPLRVSLPPEARKLYEKMEKELVISVKGRDIMAPIALAKMTKLSQISGGFIRDTEKQIDYPIHTAKLDALEEKVEDLKEAGVDRVVIFARFLWEMDEICKRVANSWCVYQIKGGIKPHEEELARRMFRSGGGIMLCQIASGSLGLNLQSANYCIFYSSSYSWIDFNQACSRIHRDGQTKTSFYYLMSCKNTIDNRIYRIVKENKNAAEEFRQMVEDIKNDHNGRSRRGGQDYIGPRLVGDGRDRRSTAFAG